MKTQVEVLMNSKIWMLNICKINLNTYSW